MLQEKITFLLYIFLPLQSIKKMNILDLLQKNLYQLGGKVEGKAKFGSRIGKYLFSYLIPIYIKKYKASRVNYKIKKRKYFVLTFYIYKNILRI